MKFYCEKCNETAEISIQMGMVVFKHGEKWCPYLNDANISLIDDIAEGLFNSVLSGNSSQLFCCDDLVLQNVAKRLQKADVKQVFKFVYHIPYNEQILKNNAYMVILKTLDAKSIQEILELEKSLARLDVSSFEEIKKEFDIECEWRHGERGFLYANIRNALEAARSCKEGLAPLQCLDTLKVLNEQLGSVLAKQIKRIREEHMEAVDEIFAEPSPFATLSSNAQTAVQTLGSAIQNVNIANKFSADAEAFNVKCLENALEKGLFTQDNINQMLDFGA